MMARTRTMFRVVSNPAGLNIPAYALANGMDPIMDVVAAIARANRGQAWVTRNYGPRGQHKMLVVRGGMGNETASAVLGQVEFVV